MNELELESELKSLTPAAPSRALREGIALELGEGAHIIAAPQRLQPSVRTSSSHAPWFLPWFDRLLWSGFGATAAMIIFMLSQKSQDQNATQVTQATSQSQSSHEIVPLDAS